MKIESFEYPSMKLYIAIALILSIGLVAYTTTEVHNQSDGAVGEAAVESASPYMKTDEFAQQWFQGKAELTSYELEQARYGRIHKGRAVLIYVTEDFLTDRHVKLDSPPNGRPHATVLKLNLTKNFNTGIYPYSMMTSVFTPLDLASPSYKVSSSSQEWCGHTFTQLNLDDAGGYDVEQRSYFESEGDTLYNVKGTILEDEIWTRLRLNPHGLPTGKVMVVPGTMSARLRHTDLQPVPANASLRLSESTGAATYTVDYNNGERVLAIEFEDRFPYAILGWTETYRDGWGANAQMLTTRAVRRKSIMSDYWRHHTPEDTVLQRELGLEGREG
jgi:hypothetical protein